MLLPVWKEIIAAAMYVAIIYQLSIINYRLQWGGDVNSYDDFHRLTKSDNATSDQEIPKSTPCGGNFEFHPLIW